MRPSHLVAGTLLGLAVGCGAPAIPLGGVCAEVECLPQLEIEFDRAATWTDGTYEVEVSLDETVVTCVVTVPIACDAAPACPEDSGLNLELSACDEPTALFGLTLAQGGMPDTIEVTVRQDDQTLGSGTFTPAYELSQPAGMGCLPICSNAPTETLELE